MGFLDSSGVTRLCTDLKSRFAAASHNHAASNITSGTLAIGRIPTGTTSSTVALGNHTHSDYQPTLVSGTNIKTINSQSILGSGDLAIQEGTEMVVLAYGKSTWADFEAVYPNAVVYCRASSNSNPASGAQTRMAFMAYVNSEDAPTEVEFQYYRSVSTKSATQQGDQVFVYKLNKTSGWSVTTREASTKIAAGTGMTQSYASGTLTLQAPRELPTVTSSDDGKVLGVVNGAWAKTASEATKSWYGTCSSGSNSNEKVITISGFTSSDIVEGTLITVLFSYNSMYAGNINLELSGVDYGVYYNGSATSSSNPLTWTQPNNVVTFIYHYPNWHYVSASSPIIPKASQSTLGGVKVGSGLSIDSDGVLSASGGGGGGGSVLTLYTNSNWSVLYADQARTQTFIDSCGWSIDTAVAAIQSADSVKVEYSSGSVSETCVMTSFYIDTLEDERRLCFRDRNAIDRAIDITWE